MDQQDPKKTNVNYKAESLKVMSIAFELGFVIALPILAFATLGKWLDSKYGTGYFVYIGIVLAIATTSLWLYRRFSEMVKKLEEAAKSSKKDSKDNQKEE